MTSKTPTPLSLDRLPVASRLMKQPLAPLKCDAIVVVLPFRALRAKEDVPIYRGDRADSSALAAYAATETSRSRERGGEAAR